MPLDTTIQRMPWVLPPSRSPVSTIAPQMFSQSRDRAQRQKQFEAEQERLKESQQERAQLESRQFAAQQAYQTAVDSDIAKAQEQVDARMDGSVLDDDTRNRIAAKHFLRYGPSMGAGFGGTLSTILNMPRKEDELLQRQFYQQGILQSKKEQETGRNVRADKLNTLRQTLATERNTRGFAPPEIARLVKFHDDAIAAGDSETADIYAREITLHQAKAGATSKARMHSELSTTLRQQMRAVDANKKFTQSQKDELKAPLLKQLDQSRRDVLNDLESDLPVEQTAEEQATANALTNIDKQIADIEVELKRKPGKGALDFGKDNRQIKLDDLKGQRERLAPKATTSAPAATPKPPGLSDDDLLNEAREAIKQGKDPAVINEMLKAWGVKGAP